MPDEKPRTSRTRQRAREDATAAAKTRFLTELAKMANVTAAAKKAKVPRSTAYDWYAADPGFAAAWDEALKEAADAVDAEIWRRGITGWREPVFQGGKEVGVIRRYSDAMLTLLAKAHSPERYKDRTSTELSGPGGTPLLDGVVQIYLPGNGRDELEDESTVEVQPS